MKAVLVVIVAYLIGSIPFGYLIVRMKSGGDVRRTGSGGTGATNVSRSAGKTAGILTLILDALKGALAVLFAISTNADSLTALAGVAAIVGHIFPVWLGFRGGKGVATGAGVFLILAPLALLFAGVVFLGIVLITRYVSLGSIVAAASIPFFIYLQTASRSMLAASVAGVFLIIFAHRGNIGRLLRGTEPKFS